MIQPQRFSDLTRTRALRRQFAKSNGLTITEVEAMHQRMLLAQKAQAEAFRRERDLGDAERRYRQEWEAFGRAEHCSMSDWSGWLFAALLGNTMLHGLCGSGLTAASNGLLLLVALGVAFYRDENRRWPNHPTARKMAAEQKAAATTAHHVPGVLPETPEVVHGVPEKEL